MKKSVPLLLVLLISLGCGPSIKTKRLAIEPAAARGQIAITIKPAEGIEATDVSRMRYLLQESFAAAGYGKVSVNSGGNPSSRTVKILLTRFEHDSSSNNTKMATGIGCAYICFIAAPCLLLPGFNEPRFEITADVSAVDNGRILFEKVMSETAKASANAFDRGNDELKKNLEVLAAHNFTAAILKQLDRK